MSVTIAALERGFHVGGWWRGVSVCGGWTASLDEAAQCVAAWSDGLSLDDLRRRFPFVNVSELALAHEKGPAEACRLRWQHLREDAPNAPFPKIAEVIEAAWMQPLLRQLFPYTAHWSLYFSTCTGFPYTRNVMGIDPFNGGLRVTEPYAELDAWRPDGNYEVPYLALTSDPDEAVAIVLEHLPADIGPAVAGTADDG